MANAKKLPSGSWRCRAYDKTTKSTKSFTAATKKEAEYLANEWLTGRKKLPPENKTVRTCLADYIELKSGVLSPSTIKGYRSLLANQFSEGFLGLALSELDGVKIQQEINIITVENAPKTVHNANGLLSAALRTYFPEFHYTATLPKVQRRVRELPLPEDVLPLFAGTDIELPVMLALWLGLRMSEITGLKRSDIVNGKITIQRTRVRVEGGEIVEKESAKNVQSRRPLAIPAPIMELIDRVDGEYITELSGDKIYHHFTKIMQRAGFGGVTFHDLRHVNASTMLKLGIPDKYAMERGGWSTTSTLKRVYQETFSDERQAVDRRVDEYFGKILATEVATKKCKCDKDAV